MKRKEDASLMKTAFAAALFAIGLMCSGCTSVTTTQNGRPFDATRVVNIQKGSTTDEQVLAWFGDPVGKHVFDADAELWVYSETVVDFKFTDTSFTRHVKQTSGRKRLELLMRNGTVENFTYVEGPAY